MCRMNTVYLWVITNIFLAYDARAHYCDLIGWNRDETQAVLWCLQGCHTENCEGFEYIQVQSMKKIEKSWSIQLTDPPLDTPLAPDNSWVRERSNNLLKALEHLRQQGYHLAPIQTDVFRLPRYNPDTASRFGTLPLYRTNHTNKKKTLCCDGPHPIEVFERYLVPYSIPDSPSQSLQGSLTFSPHSCTTGSNQQARIIFVMEYVSGDRNAAMRVRDQLALDIPTAFLSSKPEKEVELEFAYSPKMNGLILRHSFALEPDSRYTTEKLIDLHALPDIVRRAHRLLEKSEEGPKQNASLYYQGDFASDIAEYFGMYDVQSTPTVLIGGMSPFRDYGITSILTNAVLMQINPWLGVGINAELFSFRFLSEDKAFAVLNGGPSFRLGRLILHSKFCLLSFRDEDSWFPGFSSSASFPLLSNREIGFWSMLVPVPVVGLDVWFDSQLRHDQTQFWFGFSWLGAVLFQ